MATTEVEILDQPVTKREIIDQLLSMGQTPALIAQITKTPTAVVATLTRRHIQPDDAELQDAYRAFELRILQFLNHTMSHGTQSDKMALAKITLGRVMSKRAGAQGGEEIEELRMAWQELRDEQRETRPYADVTRLSVLDYDDDGDDD